MAVAPASVRLVRSEEDVDDAAAEIEPGTPVALLAQTTLSHDEWSDIMNRARERFADLWMPNRSDLCFATTNRQAALKVIAGRSDAVVVIGSVNSSNTRALEKVALASGCPRVLRVNEADELPDDLSGTVGVTAGASAPDELVEAVVARLAPLSGVEEIHVTDEDEYFPPPPSYVTYFGAWLPPCPWAWPHRPPPRCRLRMPPGPTGNRWSAIATSPPPTSWHVWPGERGAGPARAVERPGALGVGGRGARVGRGRHRLHGGGHRLAGHRAQLLHAGVEPAVGRDRLPGGPRRVASRRGCAR